MFTNSISSQFSFTKTETHEARNLEIYDYLDPLCHAGDFELCYAMIAREYICKHALDYHCTRFSSAMVRIGSVVADSWVNRFLVDAFLSYQVCGFVAFIFSVVNGEIKPCVVPFSDLDYTFIDNWPMHSFVIPNVYYKNEHSKDKTKHRVYVYCFEDNLSSVHNRGGPLTSVLTEYKRLLHIQRYNTILQNQMIKTKLCFSETRRENTSEKKAPEPSELFSGNEWMSHQESEQITGVFDEMFYNPHKQIEKQIASKIENYQTSETVQDTFENCLTLPANTTITNPNASRTILIVDDTTYRLEFIEIVEKVLGVPDYSKRNDKKSTTTNDKQKNKSNTTSTDQENYCTVLQNIEKRNRIVKKFESMLTCMYTFLHDKKSAQKVKEFESRNPDFKSVKKQKGTSKIYVNESKNNKSIPIQIFTFDNMIDCTIQIDSMDDFDFFMNLYKNSMISYEDFAPYFQHVVGMKLNKASIPETESDKKKPAKK